MPENYLAMGLLAGIFAAGFLAGYGIRSLKSLLHRRSVLERVRREGGEVLYVDARFRNQVVIKRG